MSFDTLGLCPALADAVSALGYTTPTPIQTKAIPYIMEGRDILAGARTGTGKTAAFALPILQELSKRKRKNRHPRTLILTPTRELAAQVDESFRAYGRNLKLYSMVMFGGVNINPQIKALKKGVDILVACPGRLLDHVNRGTVDLSAIEVLVLDEADRMLDMGFIRDIQKIMKCLPAKRQNMLFSATYSKEIRNLAAGLLKNPAMVEVSRGNTAVKEINQRVYPVSQKGKRALVSNLIRDGKWQQVLIFTRTKHRANRLTKQLITDGISAAAIHGNKSQATRTRALADFKNGAIKTLVATDIAARGLDIAHLPHVVNFDLPNVAEDYIHRIGRTGRAGASGMALSLVSRDEQILLDKIQRLMKQTIPVEDTGYTGDEDEAPAPDRTKNRRPARGQQAPGTPVKSRTKSKARGKANGQARKRNRASAGRSSAKKTSSWLPKGL
ncbi:MAG: DEAD/DEAH box helicase [Desulfobacterales bacterium]|nr:DEAD/DEAH box helicase [Desulfobacterales bacterium]